MYYKFPGKYLKWQEDIENVENELVAILLYSGQTFYRTNSIQRQENIENMHDVLPNVGHNTFSRFE